MPLIWATIWPNQMSCVDDPVEARAIGMCAAVGCGHVSGLMLRGLLIAGPDAIRSLAPKQIYALEWRITLDGFFQAPVRHHATIALLTRQLWQLLMGFLRLQAAPPGTAAGMR